MAEQIMRRRRTRVETSRVHAVYVYVNCLSFKLDYKKKNVFVDFSDPVKMIAGIFIWFFSLSLRLLSSCAKFRDIRSGFRRNVKWIIKPLITGCRFGSCISEKHFYPIKSNQITLCKFHIKGFAFRSMFNLVSRLKKRFAQSTKN